MPRYTIKSVIRRSALQNSKLPPAPQNELRCGEDDVLYADAFDALLALLYEQTVPKQLEE